MSKESLPDEPTNFDLKFLLIGRPGTGKTHFISTYTRGPVHFYMFDPGGERTTRKVVRENKLDLSNFTFDFYQDQQKSKYEDFWKQIQKDDSEGFFDDMASKDGLIVIDSLTKVSQLILSSVAKRNQRTLTGTTAPMRIQDWGMVTSWTRELISVIDVLPCAVAVTCHIVTDSNEDGAVIGEYPSIIGGTRYTVSNDFDEVYRLETVGNKFKINFRGTSIYEAKSRVFSEKSIDNMTMNQVYDFYKKNKPLK